MKIPSLLIFALGLSFFANAGSARETILLQWSESYNLPAGKVLTFLNCSHNIDISNGYQWIEILATIQGEVILFSARPEDIMPTFMFGGTSAVNKSGVPPANLMLHGPVRITTQVTGGATVTNMKYFQMIALVEDAVQAPVDLSATTPAYAVVIPSDATGPVEIRLESSEDMVSWNATLPGFYGASESKRFFRVRALNNP